MVSQGGQKGSSFTYKLSHRPTQADCSNCAVFALMQIMPLYLLHNTISLHSPTSYQLRLQYELKKKFK